MDTLHLDDLRALIARAKADEDAAEQAVRNAPQSHWQERYTEYREKAARRSALIEAGLVVTLGAVGDTP